LDVSSGDYYYLLIPVKQRVSADTEAEVVCGVVRRSEGDRKIQGYLLSPTRRVAESWTIFAGYSPGDLQSSYWVPVRRRRGSNVGTGASDDSAEFGSIPMHDPDSPLPRLRPGAMFLYKGTGVSLANVNIPILDQGEARFVGVVFGERGEKAKQLDRYLLFIYLGHCLCIL